MTPKRPALYDRIDESAEKIGVLTESILLKISGLALLPEGLIALCKQIFTEASKIQSKVRLRDKGEDDALKVWSREWNANSELPYDVLAADMVCLNRLRGRLKLGSGEIPPKWGAAIKNYFRSDLGRYTIRDMVTRYDVFTTTRLDRYGKPPEKRGLSETDDRTTRGDRRFRSKKSGMS